MSAILSTAFLEGLCVLIVEIAGARALAPYFGASLHVWTAQITATLLFLALGYALGGMLSKRGPHTLPVVLLTAGTWLCLYPVWRGPLLAMMGPLGISGGAFCASALLFGPPLLCMGAVSPLLISRLSERGIDSGQAAGRLFFTNTLGGLAGGWLTALVLLPHAPLRFVLAGTGVLLALLGVLWGGKRAARGSVWLVPIIGVGMQYAARDARTIMDAEAGALSSAIVVERFQGPGGAVQVVDRPDNTRVMLINGTTQGGLDRLTQTSSLPFSEYLSFLGHRYHPHAKSALLLGLGPGVLATTLHKMGVQVTVAEIEPSVVTAARKHFGLPDEVRVITEDARAVLATDSGHYDLVVLDAFAGETSPWYLLTREGIEAAKARLAPGGRFLLNTITRADGGSAGLIRVEAMAIDVFGEALVYIEPRLPTEQADLVNATLIAGSVLRESDEPYPVKMSAHVDGFIGDMIGFPPRAARPRSVTNAVLDTDDQSSLEMVEASLRLRWRQSVLDALNPDVLQD